MGAVVKFDQFRGVGGLALVAIHNFDKYFSQFIHSLVIATLSEWFAAEK